MAYSFLAATLSADPGRGVGWLVGDLLVRYPSAAAHTRDTEPPSPAVELVNVRHVPRLNHIQLLNNRQVADQLATWLAPTAHQPSASTLGRRDPAAAVCPPAARTAETAKVTARRFGGRRP